MPQNPNMSEDQSPTQNWWKILSSQKKDTETKFRKAGNL